MLSVLAIAALIVTTGAFVEEFSEDALIGSEFIDPYSPEINAELVNPQIQIRLHTPYSYKGAVYLDATAISDQIQETSSTYNGITLNNGEKNYQKITSFGFSVTRDFINEVVTYVRFDVIFGTPPQNNFILSVPVYQIPRELSKASYNQLKNWANKAKVGVIPPVNAQQLLDILQNKPITLGIKWLEELLAYEVRDSIIKNPNTTVYAARPVVLPQNYINNIIRSC